MKSVYRSEKYRHFNHLRSEKALLARTRQNEKGNASGNTSHSVEPFETNNRTFIIAPDDFSMINNMSEFLKFLNNVDIPAWHGKNVHINLSEVKK